MQQSAFFFASFENNYNINHDVGFVIVLLCAFFTVMSQILYTERQNTVNKVKDVVIIS